MRLDVFSLLTSWRLIPEIRNITMGVRFSCKCYGSRKKKLRAIDVKDLVKLLRGGLGQRGPGLESGFTSPQPRDYE